jgi:hypothetical protein
LAFIYDRLWTLEGNMRGGRRDRHAQNCRESSHCLFPLKGPFEGNPPSRVGLDIRRRNDFHGHPDTRKRPNDRLGLQTPPADLPSIFWRLYELETCR